MSGSLQTIDRMMLLLKSFTKKNQKISLAEFHKMHNISKSSLQRILNSLIKHRFIVKNEEDKTYQLGIEVYYLGKLVEEGSNLLTVSKPLMDQLRNETGESISLNVIDNNQRKCIAYSEGYHELRTLSFVGQISELNVGASAKLLFAFLPEEKQNHLLPKLNFNKNKKKEEFIAELKTIKEEGYSTSSEERVIGGFALSCPIFNRENEMIAAVTISMPIVRRNNDINEHLKHMKALSKEISKRLS